MTLDVPPMVAKPRVESPERQDMGDCGSDEAERKEASAERRARQQHRRDDNGNSNAGLPHASIPAPTHWMTPQGTESSRIPNPPDAGKSDPISSPE
ncbi:MAG: hypothetical protein ACREDL_19955 [Bradyrhizobium sp.]